MEEKRKFYGLRNDYMFRATMQESEETLRNLLAVLMGYQIENIAECRIENPLILGNGINKENDFNRDLILWAKIFKAESIEEIEKIVGDRKEFEPMVLTLKKLNADELFRQQCEERELYEIDRASDIYYGEMRGEKRGREEGIKEGEDRFARLVCAMINNGEANHITEVSTLNIEERALWYEKYHIF